MRPGATTIFCWLLRDTWRQSLSNGMSWLLLAVSAVTILTCLSLQVDGSAELAKPEQSVDFLPRGDINASDPAKASGDGVAIAGGQLRLLFGAVRLPLARDVRDGVHFLHVALGMGLAGSLGLLLTLIWTAGFVPSFIDPRAASILIAKPPSRRLLLVGKYLAVVAVVAFHSGLYVGGVWLALGFRTGIWDVAFLWCAPALVGQFSIFYGFSVLLAVSTRSTVACVFGTIACWMVCWGMNYGRHAVRAESYQPGEAAYSNVALSAVEVGYWTMPKPADMGAWLYDRIGAADCFGQVAALNSVSRHGDLHLGLSLLASLAFLGLLIFASCREFAATDY